MLRRARRRSEPRKIPTGTNFELEILHDDRVSIEVLPHVAIVVVIGENMKGTPGISGRTFGAMGRQGINIIAIAQGSSELSISFAVKASRCQGGG